MTNPDESYDDMPHVAAYDSFNDFVESGVPENWWHPQYRFKRFADRYPLTTQFQMAVCMLIQEAFRQNRRGGSARKQAHENVTQEFVKWGNLDHYLPGIKIEPDDLARYIDSVFNHCRAHHGFPKFLDRDELLVELGVMPNHGRRGDPAPARMLVYSMIPAEAGTVAYLFGPSQAGKTFVAVDLCHALADHDRKDFFGRAIDEHVGSVIIAAEGAGAIDNRILTVERAKSKRADPLPITWIPAPRISNTADIKALINQLKKIAVEFDRTYGVRLGLIVIDTELAAFQITNENDNALAAESIKKMQQIGRALGATVLAIHHPNKDGTLRGASARWTLADTILRLFADINLVTGKAPRGRELALVKARDDATGPIGAFKLKHFVLGKDQYGRDYGSMYVVPTNAPLRLAVDKPEKKAPSTKADRLFIQAVEKHLDDGKADLDNVRETFIRLYKGKGSAARMAWARVLEGLPAGYARQTEASGQEWIAVTSSVTSVTSGVTSVTSNVTGNVTAENE